MASFTDQISNFNPYVQQLPVEAMAQVGMQKQAQYDAGVQKIQGYIDNIAGIDLVKDPQKQLLQSKLGELGNRLKTVAAGDFSNQQLVNSVGGMANEIMKDEKIQAAISDTTRYKKNMQLAEEDTKKTGGANVYNKDKFLKSTSKWLSDGSVDSRYNSEYVEHRNVYNKLVEIGKTVGIDSTTINNVFVTDSNGNPKLKNGALEYNDVMAETLLKGKDKGKLLSAFQSGLDAGDYRQLGINGEYELKNKTPEELQNLVEESFGSYEKNSLLRKEQIQDKILEIKSTVYSPKEQIEADAQLKSLEDNLAILDNNITKKRESIDRLKSADPDAIRASIYTNNFLNSVSDSLSEKETYTKYTKNPAVEVMMDREKIKIQKSTENRLWEEFKYKKQNDATTLGFNKWKTLFDAGLVDENGIPTGADRNSGKIENRPIDDISNPSYFTNNFEQGLTDTKNAQFGLYEKVAVGHWLAYNSGKKNPKTGVTFTEAETREQIAAYAKKVGMSYNDYIVLQGQKATDNFNNSKNSIIGNEYAEDIRNINGLSKVITDKIAIQKNEDKFVKANAVGFTPFDYNKANIKPVITTLTLPTKLEGGKYAGFVKKNINISKEDLYKFAVMYDTGKVFGVPVGSKGTSEQYYKFKLDLEKKYGEVESRAIYQYLVGVGSPGKAPLDNMIDAVKSDTFKKTNDLKEKYYKSISDIAVPQKQILYKGKPEQEKALISKLTSIASDYTASGIGGYDEFTVAAADPKSQFQLNIDPSSSKFGKNRYSLQATLATGDVIEKPITEKHYESLSGRTAPSIFEDKVTAASKAFGTGSTNSTYHYTDNNAYTTAFLKPEDFVNTSKYRVAADFAVGGPDRYFPKLYIDDGKGFKLYNYNPGPGFQGLSSKEADAFATQVVDDRFINGLLQRK